MCAPDKVLVDGKTDVSASMAESSSTTTAPQHEQQNNMKNEELSSAASATLTRSIRLCVASLGLLMMAVTLTMPYQQSKRDELGCDNACQGSMTSARSALTLLGAAVVGRLSDVTLASRKTKNGVASLLDMRRACLILGVGAAGWALVATQRAQSLHELWMSLIPLAFQQNINVIKALLSDYHSQYDNATQQQTGAGGTKETTAKSDRAASTGLLGMSMGLAMMVGPVLGSSVLTSYDQTIVVALFLLAISAGLVFWMPSVEGVSEKEKDSGTTKKSGIFSFLDVPSARSPAALFVLTNRLLSALAYHMFLVVWPSSLRERFHFGPKEYGLYFSFVGLFLALSQGVVSKFVLQQFHGETPRGRVQLLVACSLITCVARYWAFYTTSLVLVYILMGAFVTAMGVSSTILGADTTQIPAAHEVGSFFGILAAVESGAGMAGPLAASVLAAKIHPTAAPLGMVVILNLLLAAMTWFGYERFVFDHIHQKQQQVPASKHEKQE